MNEIETGNLFPKRIWEDLVLDFLDLACFISEEQKDYLISQLSQLNIQTENIDIHPSFSIQGKLIVICEEVPVQECWVYFAKQKRIQRWVEAELPEVA